MKKPLRQLLTFFVLLAVIEIFRLPYDDIAAGAFEQIRRSMREQGLLLETKNVDLRFPGRIVFTGLGVVFPARPLPLPLHADSAAFRPHLLDYLLLRHGWSGEFALYEGSLRCSFATGAGGGQTINGELSGIRLEKHPVLSTNGISGTLSGSLAAKMIGLQPLQDAVLQNGLLDLALESGQLRGGQKIAGLIPIPSAQDINLRLKAEGRQNRIDLRKAELFSSLGEAAGSGVIHLSNRLKIQTAALEFTVKLTAQGAQALGGYLALAANLPPDSPVRSYRIKLEQRKDNPKPKITISPL